MRNFNVTVDGKTYSVQIEEAGSAAVVSVPAVVAAPAPVAAAPAAAPVAAPSAAPKAAPVAAGGTSVTAPMPGMVVGYKVASGAAVKKGQVVAVLEAMKMENDIAATADGVITLVASKGASVNTGDVLATIN